MDQNNLDQIIGNIINKTPIYEFKSPEILSQTHTDNSKLKQFSPVLELYQYEIVNHPEKSHVFNPLEYDSLTDNDSACSIYSYSDEPNTQFKISSCDIINNGEKINLSDKFDYYYQYLQNLYKIAKLKNNQVLDNPDILKKIIIPYELVLKLISDYERIFVYLINFKKTTECEQIRSNKINISTILSNNYVNHIKKINTNNNEKFVCIGDVHGSIHSFIRLLFRFHKYGIIDIKTMKINEPYNIVFLGDVIDRGSWGVEITCTLLILLITNPDRMHWNTGNHEDKQMNKSYGFLSEVVKKYSYFNNQDQIANLYESFNKFYGYLSCAIIIHNIDINKKYWLAHGGIPQKIQSEFSESEIPVEPDIPFNKFFYSFDPIKKNWKITEENDSLAKNYSGYYLISDEIAHSIKWSDFPYEGECSGRGGTLKCNSYEYFMGFMNKYDINGIVRGHQDSISNSLVYKRERQGLVNLDSMVLFNDPDRIPINNIYWNGREDTINKSRYYGPLARLHMDLFKEPASYTSNLVQPIVTLSTNTDMGRKLTADSFGLLRFDIEHNQLDNFKSNILESKNKIIHLNNQPVSSFKQKYLKYKTKYLKLKNQAL